MLCINNNENNNAFRIWIHAYEKLCLYMLFMIYYKKPSALVTRFEIFDFSVVLY